MSVAHLHHGSSYRRLGRQTREHAIVGDKAIPTHPTLFQAIAFPAIVFRQGRKVLFHPQIHWHSPGGAMHFLVEAITPLFGLVIEVINIGEAYPRPEACFNDAHTALNFALGLRLEGLADPRSDAKG